MIAQAYNRDRAFRYAERWALGRNPAYYDFTDLGGDCTNFVSQCLFAGGCKMNDRPQTGWYYIGLNNRAPAWTGVEALYRFLSTNLGPGPFARECGVSEAETGDVIQLAGPEGKFYHTLFIVRPGIDPRVAAHDFNAWNRPLSDYNYAKARFLHIIGADRER